MKHGRIAVGLDGSAPARQALAWAINEARRRRARVLVVTAWPDESRRVARTEGRLYDERMRLQRMQVDCIAAATRGDGRRPMIARELVLGDPVRALSHAARRCDLVVVGGGAWHNDRAEGHHGDERVTELVGA